MGVAGAACQLADLLGFQSVNCNLASGIAELMRDLPGQPRFDLEELREKITERLQSVDIAA